MEIKAYILDFTKLQNNGGLKGAWFTPPVNLEDIKEKIGLNDKHKYAIADVVIVGHELPFDIDEHTSIEELNHLCDLIKKLEGTPVEFEMKAVQKKFFGSFDELLQHIEDIKCYPACYSMSDMAHYLINEKDEISINLKGYIDYEAYGRYIEAHGNYLVTSHGVFNYLG